MIDKQKRNAYPWRMSGALVVVSALAVILFGLSTGYSQPVCGSVSSGPTDNPIVQRYGDYAWTDSVQWSCVYNINDFEGASDQQRFNQAHNAAFENGGGVVYLPSGVYTFTDDLILREGVVVRGDPSLEPNAISDRYEPPTKLGFPAYEPTFTDSGTSNDTAFKVIRASDSDSRIGLVNLDINRAGIELGRNIEVSHNQEILIYGIRSNNVTTPNSSVPASFQSPWLRYPNVYAANIKIMALADVLVANNRLNDSPTDDFEQPNYQLQDDNGQLFILKEGWKVPFNYTNHYGISVNRFKDIDNIFFSLLANPQKEPGLFRKGIVIRDNWVYHTMRVGIHASGNGLVIQDNVIRDQPIKRWHTDKLGLGPAYLNHPTRLPRNITYENRAIDWSGWNVTVQGNDYEVYRHYLNDSEDQSVDGEGILIQECCGGTKVQGAEIIGNTGNSYIGVYKIPEIEDVTITENELLTNVTNTSLIYVNADTNRESHRMDDVRIEDNVVNGDILARASSGGTGNTIRNNQSQSHGQLKFSCHVAVENNIGFNSDPCLSYDAEQGKR